MDTVNRSSSVNIALADMILKDDRHFFRVDPLTDQTSGLSLPGKPKRPIQYIRTLCLGNRGFVVYVTFLVP